MFSRFVSQPPGVSSEGSPDLDHDPRLPGLIQQHLTEYRVVELRKREVRLVEKLRDCRERLGELVPDGEARSSLLRSGRSGRAASSLTSLSEHQGGTSSECNLLSTYSQSSLSLTSEPPDPLAAPPAPPLALHGTLDVSEINEQDARIREKHIIEFETLQQGETEGLGQFITQLQHRVVAAYGDEGTVVLEKRVAWAFIRGCRDPSVRCFLVSQGWTTSNTEALSPKDILELALRVFYYLST